MNRFRCDNPEKSNANYNVNQARWGYLGNIPSQPYETSPTADFDWALGLGSRTVDYTSPGFDEDNILASDVVSIGAGYSINGNVANGRATASWQKSWLWVADTTTNPAIDGFRLLSPYDWNEPGFKVLDGAANKFDTVNGCKEKCAEMDNCEVGVYVHGEDRHGECWLASKMANASNADFCGQDSMKQCTAFQKAPVLTMRTCNAYVYESHMVLPGGAHWDLNKFFGTGVVFEVKEGVDQYSETLFGPVTARDRKSVV